MAAICIASFKTSSPNREALPPVLLPSPGGFGAAEPQSIPKARKTAETL